MIPTMISDTQAAIILPQYFTSGIRYAFKNRVTGPVHVRQNSV
uniref:Uncharacterized protein n=1 Tax=Anguilla anguilla TaxID=7936 RepID=A0A0E9SDJ4_ANGAN